jgi:hypothetical protein
MERPAATVAFGPEVPGWGSWLWAGDDIRRHLAATGACLTIAFPAWEVHRAWDVPDADAVVVVKHAPPPEWAEQVARRAALLYAPIDSYGSAAAIDAHAATLRRCARILIHAEPLRKYFEPFAPVEYIDHHIKFAAPLRVEYRSAGDLLWVGVRSNLPPLVAWVNEHELPYPLDVLTNLEDQTYLPTPAELGFRPDRSIRIHDWCAARQAELTATARGVLDIKGTDFRARHKPPAKGIDVIASGVPLAMNADSSTVEHLARLGFDVAEPLDFERWFSRDYWDEARRFGQALRELLSLERVARRYQRIIHDVLAERHGWDRNGRAAHPAGNSRGAVPAG